MEMIRCDAAFIKAYFDDFTALYEELLLVHYPDISDAPEHSRAHINKLIKYLEDGIAVIFSAVDKGRPVGFIHSYERSFLHERRLFIEGLMVDAGYRKMSLGSRLIDAAEAYARENGIDAVEVMVTTNNPGAVRFYEKCGMETVRLHMKKDMI